MRAKITTQCWAKRKDEVGSDNRRFAEQRCRWKASGRGAQIKQCTWMHLGECLDTWMRNTDHKSIYSWCLIRLPGNLSCKTKTIKEFLKTAWTLRWNSFMIKKCCWISEFLFTVQFSLAEKQEGRLGQADEGNLISNQRKTVGLTAKSQTELPHFMQKLDSDWGWRLNCPTTINTSRTIYKRSDWR